MKTAAEIRHENLSTLIDRYGGVGELNVAIGRKREDATLRQVKNGTILANGKPRLMGDAVAREVEETLGLERGWMDHLHEGSAARSAGTTTPVAPGMLPDGAGEGLQFFVDRTRALASDLEVRRGPKFVTLPLAWIEEQGLDPGQVFACVAMDGWMEPVVPDGSVVIASKLQKDEPITPGTYVVGVMGLLRLCNLQRLMDGRLAVSYKNPERLPEVVTPCDDPSDSQGFRVLGRARLVVSIGRL